MNRTRFVVMLLLAPLVVAKAEPGRVYKCGPDGRQLQQQPCEGGRMVETSPAPSADDRAAARGVARRDRELADRMERERLRREEADLRRNAGATNLGPETKPAPPQRRTPSNNATGPAKRAPKSTKIVSAPQKAPQQAAPRKAAR